MAFDSKKTILLEKTYLYVRASLGFQLEGTSTEKIPTNNGFYRFFVDNLQKSIGNSYVNILYDSQDLTLQCFCSDLYMDELMSSDSSAIEDVVEELKKNTSTIVEFESGVSSAFESNHQDNVLFSTLLQTFSEGAFYYTANNIIPFFSSRSGDLTFGVSPNIYNYLLDVDKFYFLNDKWVSSENINVRGTKIFRTFIDSVFDFDTFTLNCKRYLISSTSNKKFLETDNNDVLYFRRISTKPNSLYYSTTFNNFYIVICTDFSLSDLEFSKLVFASHSKKFSKFCYNDGDISSLYFYRVESCSTCCINQVVDVPFSKDTLYFSFDSNLDLDTLKSLTYHFVTDVMDVSFTGEQLGLHYSTNAPYKVNCGPAPMLHPDGTISPSRLLRVYVSR